LKDIFINIKTAVYTNVNGDIVGYSKIIKGDYPATHRQMSLCCWVISFFLFLLFSTC